MHCKRLPPDRATYNSILYWSDLKHRLSESCEQTGCLAGAAHLINISPHCSSAKKVTRNQEEKTKFSRREKCCPASYLEGRRNLPDCLTEGKMGPASDSRLEINQRCLQALMTQFFQLFTLKEEGRGKKRIVHTSGKRLQLLQPEAKLYNWNFHLRQIYPDPLLKIKASLSSLVNETTTLVCAELWGELKMFLGI